MARRKEECKHLMRWKLVYIQNEGDIQDKEFEMV